MSHENYPVLNRLLGADWLRYMVECETVHRPQSYKKISYVGTLVELENALDVVEKRLKTDSKFSILLDHLKAGTSDEGWEVFEHAFAIVKELKRVINKHLNEPLELFPPTEESELDFRLEVEGQWIYFEVKASSMLSFQEEFLHSELEKRISQKIQQELDFNLFYIIYFADLKPGKVNVDAFFEFLKTVTEEIYKRENQAFPIVIKFPEDEPAVEVLIVHRKKPLEKPPWANDRNWALTLLTIKLSEEGARGKNHFFNHFAPLEYDLKKRLENLLGHAADQMYKDVPNVLILYTREVALGDLNELYMNCESLFTERGYTIIDGVVINVEDQTRNLTRRLFERHGSKLPVHIDSLL